MCECVYIHSRQRVNFQTHAIARHLFYYFIGMCLLTISVVNGDRIAFCRISKPVSPADPPSGTDADTKSRCILHSEKEYSVSRRSLLYQFHHGGKDTKVLTQTAIIEHKFSQKKDLDGNDIPTREKLGAFFLRYSSKHKLFNSLSHSVQIYIVNDTAQRDDAKTHANHNDVPLKPDDEHELSDGDVIRISYHSGFGKHNPITGEPKNEYWIVFERQLESPKMNIG